MMRTHSLPRLIFVLMTAMLCVPQALHAQYTVSTVAGGGPNNLPILSASIGYPGSIAFDAAGNSYIADSYSSHIFKVTSAGTLTVVAGNGTRGYSGDGGPATSAALSGPEGVFVDTSGNIFIADTENSVIREVVASSGNIKTVAGSATLGAGYGGDGGPATSAQLSSPFGIFVDGSGNIFIADADNSAIREVLASNGNIQTVAGNGSACTSPTGPCGDGGPATSAQLNLPESVFVDGSGNIFIADTDDNVIREVTAGTGNIQTVAGSYYQSQGGTACSFTAAPASALATRLCAPSGVTVDSAGDILIADTNNSVIWEVTGSNVTLIAGTGTPGFSGDNAAANAAQVNFPSGVVLDTTGDLFIADTDNFVIREVSGGNIQTVIGNLTLAFSGDGGSPANAELNYPGNVYVDGSGDIFIADSLNSAIREVVASTGNILTIAGNGTACASSTTACGDNAAAASAQLNNPYGLALDASGNLYIADTENHRIRVVNTGTASITIAGVAILGGDIATVAGTGTAGYTGDGALASAAELFSPSGVFVDPSGNIFIADTNNHVIREVSESTGFISTIAGNGTQCAQSSVSCGDGEAATAAQLSIPTGVALDSAGNIYIADEGSNRVRAVNPSTAAVTLANVPIAAGDIATVAGTGVGGYSGDGAAAITAELAGPENVVLDASGNIFISDTENFVLREVIASSGFIATVAGNNTQGFAGDGGTSLSAIFNTPVGLFGDSAGDLFVADTGNSRIRKLTPSTGTAAASTPTPQSTTAGGTATFSIQLNANTGNPNFPITLSCLQSSLPSGATCSFSPAKITPGPLPIPFTLSVSVPASSAALLRGGRHWQFATALTPLFGMLFVGTGIAKRRRCVLMVMGLALLLLTLGGCGSGGGNSGGSGGGTGTTYQVKVQGATAQQTTPATITTATLTVQ